MIRSVTLNLSVTLADGTVLSIPASVMPSLVQDEDARVFQALDKAASDSETTHDEQLLRIMIGSLRSLPVTYFDDTWPGGDPPKDVLDRMAVFLCGQLHARGSR